MLRLALTAILFIALLAVAGPLALAADPSPADPENTLLLDLDYGRVVIRMRPDLAPVHVARIKHLVRDGFYDGMVFHRVIDGFMAQTGDPTGKGTSGSGRQLKAEFTRTPQGRGTVSMARGGGKDSADSQFFIVLSDSNRQSLDGNYTAWGQVTAGMDFVDMIHKGNPARNGTVAAPDHLVRMQIAADVDRAAAPDQLAGPAVAAEARDFSAAEFRCAALTDSAGAAAQSTLARLWTHGYLAGSAKAQNKLAFDGTDAAVAGALRGACRGYPEAFLLIANEQLLAKTPPALPATTRSFPANGLSCKDYATARAGADTATADFADLWALAFIQGFKNVGQPGMEIPFAARPTILAPIAANCAKNADMTFLDLTALVAAKVKLK